MGGFSELDIKIKNLPPSKSNQTYDRDVEEAIEQLERDRFSVASPLLSEPDIVDYLNRINAVPTGLTSAAINGDSDVSGYAVAVAAVKFKRSGEVSIRGINRNPVKKEMFPTEDEERGIAAAIQRLIARGQLPDIKPVPVDELNFVKAGEQNGYIIPNSNGFPRWLSGITLSIDNWETRIVKQDRVAVPILDVRGQLTAIEFRVRKESDGKKIVQLYRPFSDGVWRVDNEELPLVGAEQLAGASGVLLFEGPKGLAMARMLVDPEKYGIDPEAAAKHPWTPFLKGKAHGAFVGGTNNIELVDFRPLRGGCSVTVVNDADGPGYKAARDIARRLAGRQVHGFEFPAYYPNGWDLADGVDAITKAGSEHYGEYSTEKNRFKPEHLRPENYLTNLTWVATGFGNNIWYIPGSIADWAYIREHDEFSSMVNPNLSPKRGSTFNNMFDHRANTTNGLDSEFRRDNRNIYDDYKFAPHMPRDLWEDGTKQLNLWQPPLVDPIPPKNKKAMQPFFDFLRHVAPNPWERFQLYRWIATVIARQDWKIPAVLIHSPVQGTGKSMTFHELLRPIIGPKMCSMPNVEDILNVHRTWYVNKTLALVDDIPPVANKHLAQGLKTVITSPTMEVNRKWLSLIEVDCHCTLYATSQYPTAIMLEGDDDRRWLIIQSNSKKLPPKLLASILAFRDGKGLSYIRWMAENFEDLPKWMVDEIQPSLTDVPAEVGEQVSAVGLRYLPHGKPAPWTYSKLASRSESGSEPVKYVIRKIREEISARKVADQVAYLSTPFFDSIYEQAGNHRVGDSVQRMLGQKQLRDAITGAGLFICRANNNDPNAPNYYQVRIKKTINGKIERVTKVQCVPLLPVSIVDELEADGLILVDRQNMTYEPHPDPKGSVLKMKNVQPGKRVGWRAITAKLDKRIKTENDLSIWGETNYSIDKNEGDPF